MLIISSFKLLLWISYYFVCVSGFNVDINFPIIYKSPTRNVYGRNSYFGYSVLLHNSWIQIGAPRANSSNEVKIREPGVTYHCEIKGKCVEKSLKLASSNHAWFGVAMAFESRSMGHVVVCGHRWRKSEVNNKARMPGACYLFQAKGHDHNITKMLLPFYSEKEDELFVLNGKRRIAYKSALSQCGASVHITPSGRKNPGILFGSPGYLNWRGTVVHCKDAMSCNKNPKYFDTYRSGKIKDFDYLGYHVSSGCFKDRNDCVFVAGAPRDEEMTGYVVVFDRDIKTVTKKLPGRQIGEYFGSSFAVADVTRDGRDDLVVGAPFYTMHGDEGCIYVFSGHENEILHYLQQIRGRKVKGRFGSSVASVGDLDHDGFADMAVGAPYEGNGAIYIYYGSENGLTREKRISAEDVHNELRGFGISFSGLADVDGNNYPDIAVGAFLSEHVVILRTRPVVTLKSSLQSNKTNINLYDKNFTIKACLWYEGKHIPPHLNVTRKISADENYGRVSNRYYENLIILSHNAKTCDVITFFYSAKGNNLAPLEIKLSQELKSAPSFRHPIFSETDRDEFDKQVPVESALNTSSDSRIWFSFENNCGDKGCVANLSLLCYLTQNGNRLASEEPFVIGSSEKLKLIIEITNFGDTAYSNLIRVKLSKTLRLAGIPGYCDERDYISCELHTIRKNSNVTITLDIDMTDPQLLPDEFKDIQNLQINVTASSSVDESEPITHFYIVPLSLSVEVDAAIYGKSQKDIYSFLKAENEISGLEVVHVYEIFKRERSPIKKLEIELKFPAEILSPQGTIHLVPFYKTDMLVDGNHFSCEGDMTSTYNNFELSLNNRGLQEPEILRTKRSSQRDNVLINSYIPPPNRTLYINCTTPNVICKTITCQSSELVISGKVTLTMVVNVSKLDPLMGQRDILYLSSEGKIKTLHPQKVNQTVHKWPHNATASSPLIGEIREKELALWIPVSAAVGGILLVMLVTMGLAKAGFFRRTKKSELEALIRQENTDNNICNENTTTNHELT